MLYKEYIILIIQSKEKYKNKFDSKNVMLIIKTIIILIINDALILINKRYYFIYKLR